MGKIFMLSEQKWILSQTLWLTATLLLSLPTLSFSIEPEMEEEVETLDVIEISGTAVEQEPRHLNFSLPEIQTRPRGHRSEYLALPQRSLSKPRPKSSVVLLDQTAKTQDILTPIKALNTQRPPYPRQAREQGWHGRVILRLEILSDGTVASGTIHKSSGYQLLDNEAIKAATQWTFQPAKNGAFPVATTVNIPIQFDLIK